MCTSYNLAFYQNSSQSGIKSILDGRDTFVKSSIKDVY